MEEALTSYLLADAGVAGLVGSRTTWSARSQASALPAIVLQVIDGAPVYTDEGETGLTATRVQADCWRRDYASAKQVARALKARLSGARVTTGGVEFQAVFADSEPDLFERSQGGEELYRTSMDGLALLERSEHARLRWTQDHPHLGWSADRWRAREIGCAQWRTDRRDRR